MMGVLLAAAAEGDPTAWFVARAAGIAAWALVTLTVIAGMTLTTRPFGRRISPRRITDIHRTLSLAGLSMLALHGVALVLDANVDVSPLGLLVPGLVDYRTVWTSLGVIAGELMLVLHLSFRLRRYIGVRRWRSLHYAAYLAWIFGTAHGIAAGSDTTTPWMLLAYQVSIALVVMLTTWRALAGSAAARARRRREAAATASQPDGMMTSGSSA